MEGSKKDEGTFFSLGPDFQLCRPCCDRIRIVHDVRKECIGRCRNGVGTLMRVRAVSSSYNGTLRPCKMSQLHPCQD